ncbi:hypothetical protein TRFO_25988 [Tritrichomonas foetus]|uniref:Glucosyltransferase 24 catalytic domain-containing protein n=1 Tax=Tritrichomonas foetus TaxID=1144522 RepID=A0A1J4K565_9EUKA|nr:hypothetical protein TRFO_25988 [Tritrichomonas foetus]|eukprot:OHT06122.1 hypothetical protein TRFO_25988 [Tritrichomonas foetus]
MISIFLFSFLCRSVDISLKGEWKDSSLKDETIVFFEQNEPNLLSKVKSKLEKADDNKNSILDALSKTVSQPLYGLLNLSLSLRYYNPKASIKNPIDRQPSIHSWSVYEEEPIQNINVYKSIHYSVLRKLSDLANGKQKVSFLHKAISSLKDLTSNTELSTDTAAIQHQIRELPEKYFYSGINGRVIKPHYYDVLDALLEEYKNTKIFNFSKALLTKKGFKQPHYYNPQTVAMQKLEGHDFRRQYDNWKDEPNFNTEDYVQILRCKKQIVTMNIVFDLDSPESPALLRWAHETAQEHIPIYFNLLLNFDFENETAKHIAYSWHQSVDTLGVRNAVLFMIDGYKRGNFKKAYKATIPTLRWRKIPTLMKESSSMTTRIKNQLQYVKSLNIKDVGVSVNGEFIQERPIFQLLEKKVIESVFRLKEAVRTENINSSKYDEWFRDNAIELNDADLPIVITLNNYITLNGFSEKAILHVATIMSQNAENRKYSAFTINSESNSSESSILTDIDISKFTDEDLSLLKVNQKDTFTIVGPLVFKGKLTKKQVNFAERYIEYVFCTNNLETSLTKKEIALALLFRASNAIDGIERNSIREQLSTQLKIDSIVTHSPLKWELVIDPFAENAPEVIDMVKNVIDSGAASVELTPNVNHNEYRQVPNHFHRHFYSGFDSDTIHISSGEYQVKVSPYLTAYGNNNHEYFVSSVVSSSFLDKPGFRFTVNDMLFTSIVENGYFSPALPIGKYKMNGTNSKYYVIDSFVPHSKFYYSSIKSNEDLAVPEFTEKLNLVVTVHDPADMADVKALLYTVVKNTTSTVRLYIASKFTLNQINGVKTIFLPTYSPHFFPEPKVKEQVMSTWKFTHIDLYLENSERYLILSHKLIFNGDAGRFTRLRMNFAIVASPVMTENFFTQRGKPWMERKPLMERLSRPYHTSALIWVDMDRWTELHISDRFRSLFKLNIASNNKDHQIAEDLYNIMQLFGQFITLPEEVSYCNTRSPKNLARKALAVELCSSDAARLSGIKYEKVKQQALKEYN